MAQEIVERIISGEFMQAKKSIIETIEFKLSNRINDLSEKYAQSIFSVDLKKRKSKASKEKKDVEDINKQKAAEHSRLDQEISGSN